MEMKTFENNGGIEQFNGREGKTATLYHGLWFLSACA
jgi:hypothetical protein